MIHYIALIALRYCTRMSSSEPSNQTQYSTNPKCGYICRGLLVDTMDLSGKQRTAAVKILKEKWNDNLEILQRFFQDEANLLKNLSHPNILQVDGLIEIENRAAFDGIIDGIDLKQF